MLLRVYLVEILGLLVLPSLAVFSDEAYSTDLHHALLGIPLPDSTFFQRPQPSVRASLLYTQSDRGILGAVNPRDGTLVWRVIAGDGGLREPGVLIPAESAGAVLSAYGSNLQCLDAQTGRQRWVQSLGSIVSKAGIEGTGPNAIITVQTHDGSGNAVTTAWSVVGGEQVWFRVGNHVSNGHTLQAERTTIEDAGSDITSVVYVDGLQHLIHHTEKEDIVHEKGLRGKVVASWPRTAFDMGLEDAAFTSGTSDLARRSDGSFALRAALVSENGDWSMFQNGKLVWTREEGMSGIIAADWVEKKSSNRLAEQLEEEVKSNILSAYVHRTTRHVQKLLETPAWFLTLPRRILSSVLPGDGSDGALDETFGFDKVLLLATEQGWLYALDALHQGKLAWRTKVMELEKGEKWDLKGLLHTKSTDEISLKDSRGRSAVVEAASGKLLRRSKWISRPLTGTTTIQDATGENYLLPVTHGGMPSNAQLDAVNAQHRTLLTQTMDGRVQGVRFERAKDHWYPKPAWSFSVPRPAKIHSVISRPDPDPAASLGRTFGDRSVLYKYLNPNLVMITSLLAEQSASPSATATFTLVDGLSGSTIHTFTITSVNTLFPLVSTLSENMIAISYTSNSRTQMGSFLSITELYESSIHDSRPSTSHDSRARQNNSSSQPSLVFKPYTRSLTFLLQEPISNLAISTTRQGITSRPVLATSAGSGQVVAIPRALLSPFRPVNRDPTPLELEEGLMRYTSPLVFHPSWVISHRRELVSLHENSIKRPQPASASPHILVSDTGLESTVLVAVWDSADVFATRLQPSRGFDQLGRGFGKLSLLSTVMLCGLGVLLLAPIVRRKGVLKGWRGS